MKVEKKYVLLFLLVIGIIIFSNLSLAISCTKTADCISYCDGDISYKNGVCVNNECQYSSEDCSTPLSPGYCYSRSGLCVDTCGSGGCQSIYGETSSNCCQDCGCPTGESCRLSGGSYSCVVSCSSNPQCKDTTGDYHSTNKYFCNINGDGVRCSLTNDNCYGIIPGTQY